MASIKDRDMGHVQVSLSIGEDIFVEEYASFNLRDLENKGVYQAIVDAADAAREKILRKLDNHDEAGGE